MLTTNASGVIETVVEVVAVTAFTSVTERLIVFVPFTEYCVVKLAAEPDGGVPPDAVHAYV
jgi:hypothetical protein